jgi:hypothetical protein
MACVATEDDVRRLALALPAATEKPSYGTSETAKNLAPKDP